MTDLPTKENKVADYCWSVDETDFHYQSLGDLLDCNDDIEAGRIVYRGVAVPADTASFIDSSDIIELLATRAYDEHHEYADDWPAPSLEAKAELDALLSAWVEKHCPANFYGVESIEPYTVTAEDLA